MSEKKVLHLIGGGEFGGAERHVLSLMQATDQRIITPMLACLCEGPFAEMATAAGFTTATWPMKHKLDLAPREKLKAFIAEQGIDLLHTHGVRANFLARPLAARLQLPVVTTFHSDLAFDYRHRLEYWFATALTRIGNRYTDIFIAVSASIARGMAKMGIPPDKTVTIHNGIDPAAFAKALTKTELHNRYGFPEGAKIIGTVARLHPVKGHPVLLHAAARLAPEHPDVFYLLIGDGQERRALEKMAGDLGIARQVVFAGFVEEVESLYAALDIFCLPSLMEGMGLSLVESMFCETPVVASRVGGIPELVTDGVDGLLVPPENSTALADALQRLLNDPEYGRQLATRGKITAGRFTITAMARQVEAVYQKLLAVDF
jgi:glycosyltransferase involved in cell wall biosynthesis